MWKGYPGHNIIMISTIILIDDDLVNLSLSLGIYIQFKIIFSKDDSIYKITQICILRAPAISVVLSPKPQWVWNILDNLYVNSLVLCRETGFQCTSNYASFELTQIDFNTLMLKQTKWPQFCRRHFNAYSQVIFFLLNFKWNFIEIWS